MRYFARKARLGEGARDADLDERRAHTRSRTDHGNGRHGVCEGRGRDDET